MRQIGYQPAYFSSYARSRIAGQNSGEISIMRQISRNDYPRFHLYIRAQKTENPSFTNSYELVNEGLKEKNGQSFVFNLHLDQKKPSYEGSTGHSGDYDGPAVEGEAERIKNLLAEN